MDAAYGDMESAYLYSILLIVLNILCLLFRHHGYYQSLTFSSLARMTLVNLVYDKLTDLSAYSIKEANIGKILNLISGDINMLEFNFVLIFQASVLPFSLLFGSAILWVLKLLIIRLDLEVLQDYWHQYCYSLCTQFRFLFNQQMLIISDKLS